MFSDTDKVALSDRPVYLILHSEKSSHDEGEYHFAHISHLNTQVLRDEE